MPMDDTAIVRGHVINQGLQGALTKYWVAILCHTRAEWRNQQLSMLANESVVIRRRRVYHELERLTKHLIAILSYQRCWIRCWRECLDEEESRLGRREAK
jgi:hypothetical protein